MYSGADLLSLIPEEHLAQIKRLIYLTSADDKQHELVKQLAKMSPDEMAEQISTIISNDSGDLHLAIIDKQGSYANFEMFNECPIFDMDFFRDAFGSLSLVMDNALMGTSRKVLDRALGPFAEKGQAKYRWDSYFHMDACFVETHTGDDAKSMRQSIASVSMMTIWRAMELIFNDSDCLLSFDQAAAETFWKLFPRKSTYCREWKILVYRLLIAYIEQSAYQNIFKDYNGRKLASVDLLPGCMVKEVRKKINSAKHQNRGISLKNIESYSHGKAGRKFRHTYEETVSFEFDTSCLYPLSFFNKFRSGNDAEYDRETAMDVNSEFDLKSQSPNSVDQSQIIAVWRDEGGSTLKSNKRYSQTKSRAPKSHSSGEHNKGLVTFRHRPTIKWCDSVYDLQYIMSQAIRLKSDVFLISRAYPSGCLIHCNLYVADASVFCPNETGKVFVITHADTTISNEVLTKHGIKYLDHKAARAMSDEISNVAYFYNGVEGPIQKAQAPIQFTFKMPVDVPQVSLVKQLYLDPMSHIKTIVAETVNVLDLENLRSVDTINTILNNLGDYQLLLPADDCRAKLINCRTTGAYWKCLKSLTIRRMANLSDIIGDQLKSIITEFSTEMSTSKEKETKALRRQIAVLGIGTDKPSDRRKKFYRASGETEALIQLECLTELNLPDLCTSEVIVSKRLKTTITNLYDLLMAKLVLSNQNHIRCEITSVYRLLTLAQESETGNTRGTSLVNGILDALNRVKEELGEPAGRELPFPSVTYSLSYT